MVHIKIPVTPETAKAFLEIIQQLANGEDSLDGVRVGIYYLAAVAKEAIPEEKE